MTNEEFIESIRLEGEEWRGIPDYEGFYVASSFGRVASLGRYINIRGGGQAWHEPRILSISKKTRGGYYVAGLSKEGKLRSYTVHRLIASTFLSNPDCKPQIDHIDGCKTNNKVTNLRWCTGSENMNNPISLEKFKSVQTGVKKPSLHKQVVSIKDGKIQQVFETLRSVKDYGYSVCMVGLVCKGKRKQHKGFEWMYLSDYETLVNQNVKEHKPNT